MRIREAFAVLFPRKPAYDLDRAIVLICRALPPETKEALDHTDIETVLRQVFRVRRERSLGDSKEGRPAVRIPDGDMDAAVAYIQRKAEQRGRQLAEGHVRAIPGAEVVFMRKAGLIHD